MNRVIVAFRSVGVSFAIASLALFAFAGPAAAVAPQRTFVASFGVDAGNLTCSLATPCRTFNVAIGVVNGGGEVVILDTAGYGPFTINKSVKVIGPSGVYGGISVQGGAGATTGVVINAGDTDDVTLRGLDITGVPNGAPLPLIGIDIQNAGAVHIEKSSIGSFPEDGGACIRLVTAKTVRLYVDDSFLRHCLTGIYANGNAVPSTRSGVFVDNTRIERGFNANVASPSIGVLMQGFIAVSLRNTTITRHTFAVQFDSNLANASNSLDVINSEFTQNTNGLRFSGTAGGANSQIRVSGSQVTSINNDAFNIANSAVGRNVTLTIGHSSIGSTANAVTLANSAADGTGNTRMYLAMNDTQATNIANAVDMNATNGSKTYAVVRDSTFANINTAVKTRGSAVVSASLIRSQVNNCTMVVDHGFGIVRLDGNHIVKCADDFVNNGSPNIVSNGQNMVHDIDNLSGFTYITPNKITLE